MNRGASSECVGSVRDAKCLEAKIISIILAKSLEMKYWLSGEA